MKYFQGLVLLVLATACATNTADAGLLDIETVQWIPKDRVDFSVLEPAGKENFYNSNTTLYVTRGLHRGSLIPGKYSDSSNMSYVGYDGAEIQVDYYEFLVAPVGSVSWIPNEGQVVPTDLIYGGNDPVTLDPVYICRGKHQNYGNFVILGRHTIDGGNGVCRVAIDKGEFTVTSFEVLALNAYGEYTNAGRGENLQSKK